LRLNLADVNPEGFSSFGNVNATSEMYTMHPACTISNNGKFYIFGGSSRATDGNVTSQLRVIDTSDLTAKAIQVDNGTFAKARYGASLSSYSNFLLLTGGLFSDQTSDSSLLVYRYDLNANTWSLDPAGTHAPPPLAYHVTTVYESTLLVFGGYNIQTSSPSNELWVYDLILRNWTLVPPAGTWPVPFSGAAAIDVARRILLYGGNNNDTLADTVWQLVPEVTCTSVVESCGECVLTDNCGYCTNGTSPPVCIAGNSIGPYVPSSCSSESFHSEPEFCRPNILPAPWIIPSTISALGLIVVLLIITYILDRRKAQEQTYERIE